LKQLPFALQASAILYKQLKSAPQSASFVQTAPEPPAPALDAPPLDEPPWLDEPPVLDPPLLCAPPISEAPPELLLPAAPA